MFPSNLCLAHLWLSLRLLTTSNSIRLGCYSLDIYGYIDIDRLFIQVRFTFESELPLGDGAVNIKYSGILNSDMAGFYRSDMTLWSLLNSNFVA